MHDVSWRSGVSPKHEYLTGPLAAQTRATDPDGDPFVYVDPNGVQVVVYRGTDDDLHALWWTTGVPGHDNLTVESNGPKVAGNPSVVLDVPRGIQVAFYRTTDGRLYRMYWPFGAGTPFTDELTAGFPSASLPAGDPCSYLVAEDGTYHVVYRSQDGHLQLLRWTTGAVACEDLTVLAGAPTAVDDPSAYFVPEYRTHHVIYRSGDGHLHELRWFPLTPFRGV
jgi:hypothetical protein